MANRRVSGRLRVRPEDFLDFFGECLSAIATVGENLLESREYAGHGLDHEFGSDGVIDVDLVDCDGHGKPEVIDHGLLLAPLDLLVTVYASVAVHMVGAFHAP